MSAFIDEPLPGMPTPPTPEIFVPSNPEEFKIRGSVELTADVSINLLDLIRSFPDEFKGTIPEWPPSPANSAWFEEKVNKFIYDTLEYAFDVVYTDLDGLKWGTEDFEADYGFTKKLPALKAQLVQAGVYPADDVYPDEKSS